MYLSRNCFQITPTLLFSVQNIFPEYGHLVTPTYAEMFIQWVGVWEKNISAYGTYFF